MIVAGGGTVCCDVALFLAAREEKQGTVTEMLGEIARDMTRLGKGVRPEDREKAVEVRTRPGQKRLLMMAW